MKKCAAMLLMAGLFVSTLAAATPKGWTSDFEAAKKTAAKEKRLMYVLFTGSDWCGYCVRLQKNVLSKKEFKALGEKDFVFVYLDFPRRSKADNPIANRALMQQYKVRGFPTAMVMTPEGKVLDSIIGTGSAKSYVGKLKAVHQAWSGR